MLDTALRDTSSELSRSTPDRDGRCIWLGQNGGRSRVKSVSGAPCETRSRPKVALKPMLTSDEAQLAFTSSDGSVSTVSVRQTEQADGSRTVSVGELSLLDAGDQRSITSLRWIDVRTIEFHMSQLIARACWYGARHPPSICGHRATQRDIIGAAFESCVSSG